MLISESQFFPYSLLYCVFGLYYWHLDYVIRVTLSWWHLFLATTWEQSYLSLYIFQYITFQPIRIQTVCLSTVISLEFSCGRSNWGFLTCGYSLITCSWSSLVSNNILSLNMAPDHCLPKEMSLYYWPTSERNHSFTKKHARCEIRTAYLWLIIVSPPIIGTLNSWGYVWLASVVTWLHRLFSGILRFPSKLSFSFSLESSLFSQAPTEASSSINLTQKPQYIYVGYETFQISLTVVSCSKWWLELIIASLKLQQNFWICSNQ